MVEGLHHVRERTLSSVVHHGIESDQRPRIAAADPIRCTVAIVGAGFGGIGMAIRLKLAGWHDFIILEQADTVGGVWRDNTYPNSACDIPAHLYSLSFAPSANWSRRYPTQVEIHRYLEECVERFGLTPHLRTGVSLKEATFESSTELVAATDGYRSRSCSAVPGAGDGHASSASHPGTARHRILSWCDVPFGVLEAWNGDQRQACGRDRHRRQRSAMRAIHRRARGAARAVSADASMGVAEIRSSLQLAPTLGPAPCSLAATIVARVALLDPRDARIWLRAVSQSDGRTREARPQPCKAAGFRRCIATSAHARRSHGLQAGAAVE